MFIPTLLRVALMLAYAVPGFLFIKTKAIKTDTIPAFAKVLLYVCAPALTLYSFSRATYSPELNKMILFCFGAAFVLILLFLLLFRLVFKGKYADIRWRVFTIATALGNVGFFGVPLLEHFLSDYPDVFVFSEVMCQAMNLVAWTVGMFIVSGDKSFIRPLKVVTVPNFLALCVAYPMFVLGLQFPPIINEAFALLGRMSTPLCMLILGMRLATASFQSLATDWRSLFTALVKLTVFPLAMLGLMLLLPVAPYVKAAMFLLACCPCASVILSLCEIIGQGQKSAANAVLISTILSVVTIPILSEFFLSFIL